MRIASPDIGQKLIFVSVRGHCLNTAITLATKTKTRMAEWPDDEKNLKICLLEFWRNTQTWQTDGQTTRRPRPCLCIASQGKNELSIHRPTFSQAGFLTASCWNCLRYRLLLRFQSIGIQLGTSGLVLAQTCLNCFFLPHQYAAAIQHKIHTTCTQNYMSKQLLTHTCNHFKGHLPDSGLPQFRTITLDTA